jgi:branched-chain amino acid transport system substrate-binding protein
MFKRIINRVFWLVLLCFSCPIIWADQPIPPEKERTEILIGVHLPLSGAASMIAVEQKWAYERAAEDINKAGGIYIKEYGRKLPVRLVMMDDETDPVKAAEVVERLITQAKVDFLLSGFTGAHAVLPGLITAEKYHKYYHGSVIWVPDFLKHNFQWGTMYFFDMAQGGAIQFEIWKTLPEDQRPKKPAIFVEDTPDGKQIGDMWEALAEKYGYKIALRETLGTMGIGAKDFTAQIIKAKSMDVDAIILLANTEEAVTLVRQMREVDFRPKFFHGMKGTWATEFYEALGKDAEYIFCDGFWSEDYPFPGAKELGRRYYQNFGKHSVSVGMYYALCQILWQAIEKAGTLDSAEVHQAVLDSEFDTVMGKVDYEERGIALFPLAEFQWWQGKQEVVYPLEYSTKFKVKIAPPWDKSKDEKRILIGAHLPLSGALAMVGVEQKWAYDKAVEDINKAGGIYVREYGRKLPVHLVVIDDETNPRKATEIVEQLITQTKVDFLLSGHSGAHGVLPGLTTAEKYHKYYHGAVVWVPDFLEHNFQWGTMYFFDMAQGGAVPFEIWKTLPEDQRPKKPALFMENTFDGEQMGNLLVELAEKYGYKIALWESMNAGAKDFSPQIIKAKSIGVDAILLLANTEETITLLRQMKENNFSVKFFQGWKGTWATEFYNALGKDAEYIFCDGFWSKDYPFPGAKELGERYYTEHGKYSVSVGMYYALCQVLWQAIEKAGTLDSAKVRQAVLANEFDTVMGKVDYNDKGVALFPSAGFQWCHGKQQIVYPIEYSKFAAKVAPSWDKR